MPPMIRDADQGDEMELRELDRAVWSPLVSPGPPPSGDRSFLRPGRSCLVASVDAGAIAGFIEFAPAWDVPAGAHVVALRGLGVGAAHRGRGIGRALVEAACVRAAAGGARRVTLRVLSSNPGALRIYERCGFVVEGVLRGEFIVDAKEVDDVLMARRL